MKEMFFQKKLLGKAYFIVKMTAPAMVWPVSSDKWKAPLDFLIAQGQRYERYQEPWAMLKHTGLSVKIITVKCYPLEIKASLHFKSQPYI